MRIDKRTGVVIVGGVGVLIVGYVFLKKKASKNTNSLQGPFTYAAGYDPTGGISVANIGGSAAGPGLIGAGNVGNPITGTTPIGIDPTTGITINTVLSNWSHQDVPVNPSSWQGTTNKSGSLTYLQGELAGEGSSIAALQGKTF